MNATELKALVNHEAELGVVGLFLTNQHAISVAVRDGFNENYIFQPSRRAITECIMKMHGKQEVIDLITVTQRMKMENPLIDANVECEYCVDKALVTASYLPHYVELLRELHQKRDLLRTMTEQTSRITSDEPAIEIAAQLLLEVSRISSDHNFTKSHEQMVSDVLDELKNGQCAVVPCKQDLMRRKIGGFPRGKPTVMAARPGTGKSTFMCNEIAWQLANGHRVGCLSLEMTKEELMMIMACEKCNMSVFDLKRGKYDFAAVKMFEHTMRDYDSVPFWISDRNMTINQIVSWIKTMVTHHDLDIVYLDYIQRIRSAGKQQKRYDEVSSWAHMLTDVAKETGVALVELAQISRAGEPPPGMKPEDGWKYCPKLHHLKETGALEEDAYLAVLLYPHPTNPVLDGQGLHLKYIANIAKHRGGPVGEVDLVYYKEMQRFASGNIEGAPEFDEDDMFDSGESIDEAPF